jgi:hypothetical protein
MRTTVARMRTTVARLRHHTTRQDKCIRSKRPLLLHYNTSGTHFVYLYAKVGTGPHLASFWPYIPMIDPHIIIMQVAQKRINSRGAVYSAMKLPALYNFLRTNATLANT